MDLFSDVADKNFRFESLDQLEAFKLHSQLLDTKLDAMALELSRQSLRRRAWLTDFKRYRRFVLGVRADRAQMVAHMRAEMEYNLD